MKIVKIQPVVLPPDNGTGIVPPWMLPDVPRIQVPSIESKND